MDEQLFRRPVIRRGIGFQDELEEVLRCIPLQMKLVVARLPRAVCSAEDYTVSLIEEHLGRTAGVAIGIVGQALVDHADVANSRPHPCKAPRWARLGLVVEPRRQVPCDCGRILRLSNRIPSLVEKRFWRKCRLPDELRRRDL